MYYCSQHNDIYKNENKIFKFIYAESFTIRYYQLRCTLKPPLKAAASTEVEQRHQFESGTVSVSCSIEMVTSMFFPTKYLNTEITLPTAWPFMAFLVFGMEKCGLCYF